MQFKSLKTNAVNLALQLWRTVLAGILVIGLAACDSGSVQPLSDAHSLLPPGDADLPITGSFSLAGPDRVLAISEGGNGISISVGIARLSGHQAPVALSVTANESGSADDLSFNFADPVLETSKDATSLTLRLAIAMGPIQPQQRLLTLTATDGVNIRHQLLTLEVFPVDAPDVYLLIGQSNMEGYSEPNAKTVSPGGADEPLQRIQQLNVAGNDLQKYITGADFINSDVNLGFPHFVTAEDPLHDPYDASISGKSGSRIGPGLSFAKAALPATTRDIILVPAAWGGTGFCNNDLGVLAWNAKPTGNAALGGTGLFDRAIFRVNMVLQETGGILRGILWHQGESDATLAACASVYESNLTSLVAGLRTGIVSDARGSAARGKNAPVPFIVGTMSRGDDSRGEFSSYTALKESVDEVHRSIASLVPFAATVNNDDLVPTAYPCGHDSCIHFGSAAYRQMGYRYYEGLRDILAR